MSADSDSSGHRLESGEAVGQYEIVAFLDAGGMGEVYRAHDQRLGRDVALKILPFSRGIDGDRVRRFVQEAKSAGRISHPNIVSVFDTGEFDGRPFVVTELLEGVTLRGYLETRGPLPIRQAIGFGIQIARGLAAAHDQGVVHRDLKPSNIIVTVDGHLKILDFGLAKLLPAATGSVEDLETASLASMPGVVMGSAGYMSPEQVEAGRVDHRSDIFSMGVILYEMLSGKRAFAGASAIATMSAILNDDPRDLQAARSDMPQQLAGVVRRCLEKNPDARYQSARDVVRSLESLEDYSAASFSSAARAAIRFASTRVRSRRSISVLGILGVASLALLLTLLQSKPTDATATPPRPDREPVRVVRLTTSGDAGRSVAVDPGETYLAYDRADGLWLMHIATGSSTRILETGAGEIGTIEFSPDGNYVVFVRWPPGADSAGVFRIPVLGGDSQPIALNAAPHSLTFSPDGSKLAFIREEEARSALVIVSADGSGETEIAERNEANMFLSCAWSPRGNPILCAVLDERSLSNLEVDAITGEQRPVRLARPLDRVRWTRGGKGIVGLSNEGFAAQIFAGDYPEGELERVTSDLGSYSVLSLGARGSGIAAIRIDVTTNLWATSTDGTHRLRQLTTGVNTFDGNHGIATTPDGRIVWSSMASGKSLDLYIANRDGSDRRRLTFDDAANERWPDVSPDGKTIVYSRHPLDALNSSDIYRVGLDGSLPVRMTDTGDATVARFSGDAWIYYTRFISDGTYIFRLPSHGGEPERVTREKARGPAPSPDGNSILVGTSEGLQLRSQHDGRVLRTFEVDGLRRWRRDGEAFAVYTNAGGRPNLVLQRVDGSEPVPITKFGRENGVAYGFDWMPDGREIVFARSSQTRDVVLLERSLTPNSMP